MDEERAYGLNISAGGQIAITGFFRVNIDSDPDPIQSHYLSSVGQNDAFLIQIDTTGMLEGSSGFGGLDDDVLWSSHYSLYNRLFAGGSFQNTIDIDPTPNTNLVTSNGLEDMLFLELGLCAVQADTVAVVACNQFINPADSTVQTTSGFYTANLLATDGCDSTIVFDVTINNIAPTVTQTIDGLAAQTQAQNPSYQWLYCSTGQQVPGATGQTFMPTTNGQYAVIVSDGVCTDTSACFAINNVAIGENDLANGITVYPNPTTGKLSITSSEKIETIEVYDVLGREVLTVHHPASEIDLSTLQNGVYVIRLQTKKGITVSKVIKR